MTYNGILISNKKNLFYLTVWINVKMTMVRERIQRFYDARFHFYRILENAK